MSTETTPVRRRPVEERFWSKVQVTGFCWEWTAGRDRKGYGRFTWDGPTPFAHRVAYMLMVGPIPVGMQIDHLCRNTRCVNPDHLEPVTAAENNDRSTRGRLRPLRTVDVSTATHGGEHRCPRGHLKQGANLIPHRFERLGERACLACERARGWCARRGIPFDPEVADAKYQQIALKGAAS